MNSKIEIYQSPDNQVQVEVTYENDTFWLSLNQITELFGRDKSVISRHLKNIFKEGELLKESVVAKNAITALATLTLFSASSKIPESETVKHLIISILNG